MAGYSAGKFFTGRKKKQIRPIHTCIIFWLRPTWRGGGVEGGKAAGLLGALAGVGVQAGRAHAPLPARLLLAHVLGLLDVDAGESGPHQL